MKHIPYEKGIVKVVWVDQDPEKMYSKMFDNEKKAREFAKTKGENYLIFGLEKQHHMTEFSWNLLPYGRYKSYLLIMKSIGLENRNLLHQIKNMLTR